MAIAWRLAKSLEQLRNEVNTKWPNRDKTSDGSIGDAAHSARASQHNPDEHGVVTAIDIDKDGIDADWLAEHLRQMGLAGDPRLADGGEIIWNRRITSYDFTKWNDYTGTNPHEKHIHVSSSENPPGYDVLGDWGIVHAVTTPAVPALWYKGQLGSRALQNGCQGSDVSAFQAILNRRYPLYSKLVVDGIFGAATENVVREFQRRAKLPVDGIAGRRTFAALGI